MPSRAVYTFLAASRSDTGCSTVLIPSVAEPVMVAPEVVGPFLPRQKYDQSALADASRFLIGLPLAYDAREPQRTRDAPRRGAHGGALLPVARRSCRPADAARDE